MKNKILCLFLILFTSCQNNSPEDLSVESGFWGHLQELDSTPDSKLYLSHVKKNDIYTICVPKYFLDKYEGIESEIIAGVNIWGHYIGRKIKVELLKSELDEPRENQTEQEIINDYYSKCPTNTDLVVGEAHFKDNAVGKTVPSYSYVIKNGKKVIHSFKRGLFFKYSSSEPSNETEYNWVTLSKKMNRKFTTKELLDLMINRDTKLYLENSNELLTMKTITHEFGHVWGLCDQYALSGNKTNCDPRFSTINEQNHIILNDESIMSKSNWINFIYLTHDDIEGIRQLAKRELFHHDWPKNEEFSQILIQDEQNKKDIEFVKLNSAIYKDDAYEINVALLTNSNSVSIEIEFFSEEKGKWIKFGKSVQNDKVNTNDFTFKISSTSQTIYKKIRIKIKSQDQEVNLEGEIENIEFDQDNDED